jgi:hypothetical protein
MNFIREAINDGTRGNASAKRLAIVFGSIALSFAVVILAVAACFGYDVAPALWATSSSLAALGGVAYVGGKAVER